MNKTFSHLDEKGHAKMVDISAKADSDRIATARGRILIGPRAFSLMMDGKIPKGDVLAVARIAGIMAAKKVDSLIPLCHPLPLEGMEIEFFPDPEAFGVEIVSTVKVHGKTGVEMEALTAVSIAALTIYDMCKAIDKGMRIEDIHLEYKTGGKSGTWKKSDAGGAF